MTDDERDEAITQGAQLFAARLMQAFSEELKEGAALDTARAVTELVHTKNALLSLCQELGIHDVPAKLWGPDIVKRIERAWPEEPEGTP